MNEQLCLAPVHGNDPLESLEASLRVDAKRQLEMVLLVLYRAEKPLSDDDISERAGLLRNSAGTRRGVAKAMGLVEKVGRGETPRGNPCGLWAITDAGVEYVRQLLGAAA